MLIVGKAGAGKTFRILQRVESALRSGQAGEVCLVTPTSSMARHLAHELARKGLAVPGSVVIPIKKLIEKLTPDVRESSPAVDSWLLEEALTQSASTTFGALTSSPGLLRRAKTAIDELQSAGCSPDQARNLARSSQQKALAEAYKTYQGFLDTYELSSAPQRRTVAAQEAALHGLPGIEKVFFDGFWSFSPSEIDLIRSLRNRGHKVWATARPEATAHFADWPREELQDVRRPEPQRTVVRAPNTDQEIEEIARRVVEAKRPWREIGVLVRSPEVYLPAIEAVFPRFGIPFRAPKGQPLDAHPAMRFALEMLRAISEGLPAADVLAALRRPAARMSHSSQFDRYDFDLQDRLPGEGLEFLLEGAPDQVRQALSGLEPTRSWRKDRRTGPEWAAATTQLLDQLLARPQASDNLRSTEAIELRAWGRGVADLRKALNAAAELIEFRALSACGLSTYLSAFERAAAAATLVVNDDRRDVVNVLAVHEARQWELPLVFVCGLVEGRFPAETGEDLFFSEADRQRYAAGGVVLRTRAEREADERLLFDIAATRASDELVLSWPEADALGTPLLRSFFLDGDGQSDSTAGPVRPVEEPSPGPTPAPERLADPAALAALQAKHVKFSPSGLERFLQCPYLFFAGNTLRLRERPGSLEERLDARESGTVIHGVLAEWSANPERPLREILDQVFGQSREKLHVQPGFRAATVQDRLATDLERFATEALAGPLPGSKHGGFEEQVGYVIEEGPDGEIRVGGRVDRYDTTEGGMALVVDYKHSAPNRIKKIVRGHENGTDVQGLVYLHGLKESKGLEPAGMIFCSLKGKTTTGGWVRAGVFPNEAVPEGVETLEPEHWQRLIDGALETAAKAAESVRHGTVAVAPEDPGYCRKFCAYRDVCRVTL